MGQRCIAASLLEKTELLFQEGSNPLLALYNFCGHSVLVANICFRNAMTTMMEQTTTPTPLKSAAFVTYNQIGRDANLQDGWHERNGRCAFVLQNTKGEGGYRNGRPIGTERRQEEIGLLWGKLRDVLPQLDHVVDTDQSSFHQRICAANLLMGEFPMHFTKLWASH
jgi:hypothetical protein